MDPFDKHYQLKLRMELRQQLKVGQDKVFLDQLNSKQKYCEFRKNNLIMHRVNKNIEHDIKRNLKRQLSLMEEKKQQQQDLDKRNQIYFKLGKTEGKATKQKFSGISNSSLLIEQSNISIQQQKSTKLAKLLKELPESYLQEGIKPQSPKKIRQRNVEITSLYKKIDNISLWSQIMLKQQEIQKRRLTKNKSIFW